MVVSILRIGIARFIKPLRRGRDAPGQDSVGDRITVPALNRADDRDAADHVSEEVNE
jgi:hypothetical protein